MRKKIVLEPCPFCNDSAIQLLYDINMLTGIITKAELVCRCGCTMFVNNRPIKPYTERTMVRKVVEKWNRRAV